MLKFQLNGPLLCSLLCLLLGTGCPSNSSNENFSPKVDAPIEDPEHYWQYKTQLNLFDLTSCSPSSTGDTCFIEALEAKFSRPAIHNGLLYVGSDKYAEMISSSSMEVGGVYAFEKKPNGNWESVGMINHSQICNLYQDTEKQDCLDDFGNSMGIRGNLHGNLSYPSVYNNTLAIGATVALNEDLRNKADLTNNSKIDDGLIHVFEKDPNTYQWTVKQRISPIDSCAALSNEQKETCIHNLIGAKFSRPSITANVLAVGAYEAKSTHLLDQTTGKGIETGLVFIFRKQSDGTWRYDSTIDPVEVCAVEEYSEDCLNQLAEISFGYPTVSYDEQMINIGAAKAISPSLQVETGLVYEFRYIQSQKKWVLQNTVDPGQLCSTLGFTESECKSRMEEGKFSYSAMNETRLVIGARMTKVLIPGRTVLEEVGIAYVYERISDGSWHFVRTFTPEQECKDLTGSDQTSCYTRVIDSLFSIPAISETDEVFIGASQGKIEGEIYSTTGNGTNTSDPKDRPTGKVYIFEKTETSP
jgi:hypothetical protein